MSLSRFRTPYKPPPFVCTSPSLQQVKKADVVDVAWVFHPPVPDPNAPMEITLTKERPAREGMTFYTNYGDMSFLDKKD